MVLNALQTIGTSKSSYLLAFVGSVSEEEAVQDEISEGGKGHNVQSSFLRFSRSDLQLSSVDLLSLLQIPVLPLPCKWPIKKQYRKFNLSANFGQFLCTAPPPIYVIASVG